MRAPHSFIRDNWPAGARPTAYLTGTTAIAGNPDIPVRRVVQLFRRGLTQDWMSHSSIVASQLSDAAGAWRFDGLDATQLYHAIAYDHTGVHDPVVKLNLIPTP